MSRAVIFDFNRTLYDPESDALYEGVLAMLDELRTMRRLILYSKKEGGREDLLTRLGIEAHFEAAYFVDSKTADSVRDILARHELATDECIIVGDVITSELAAGREVGLETVWLRHGKFANLFRPFEPTHTTTTIAELRALLARIA